MSDLLLFLVVLSILSATYVGVIVGAMAIVSYGLPIVAFIFGFVGASLAFYMALAVMLICTGGPFGLFPKLDNATEEILCYQCTYKFQVVDRLIAFIFAPSVTIFLGWRTLIAWRFAAAERTI